MKTTAFLQKLEKETKRAVEARERIVRNWRKIRIQDETMPTMIEALNTMQREADARGWAKVLGGKWTLKELAKFVSTFSRSSPEDTAVRHKIISTLMDATHIRKIRILGVGTYETREQVERSGPLIPGSRNHFIEIPWGKNQLYIMKYQPRRERSNIDDKWRVEHTVPFARIKKIRIVRVPVGLRHLEIELHKD